MSVGPILQVVTSTDRRGAEIFAVELGAALRDRGCDVQTVALGRGHAHGLDVPALAPRARSLAALRALRKSARPVALVIAHGSTTLPMCALALAGAGVPFIYRNIGDPSHWASSPTRRARVAWSLRRAAAVVAIADPAAKQLTDRLRVPAERISVIPNGVPAERCPPADRDTRREARRSLGLSSEGPVAAVVGALSPEKNVALAIDAAAVSPELELVVAGDGPERSALEARAATSAAGRVRFTGSLADPGPAYAATDVVVVPSRTEGLPAVVIEAGLRGLPVVATDVGFVREVVVDGETGLLVRPDDPAALAAAIAEARARGRALGRAGRARCLARFEIGPVADRWHALTDRVLTGRHSQ